MPKLPRPREVERVLRILKFHSVRQSGSHAVFKDSSGKRTTLPVHGGKTISPGVFFSILKDLNLSEKDFWDMFKNIR